MKLQNILLTLALIGSALGQGPLTPPTVAAPALGPLPALTPGGEPQATMKTLHQVEPRTPVAEGQPGVTKNPNGGFTIAAGGSYYLTSNLTVVSGSGVIITASNVTLDLHGFTIASTAATPSGAGVDVPVFVNGLTVRNGFIRGTTVAQGAAAPFTFTPGGFVDGISNRVLGPTGQVYVAVMSDLDVRGCSGTGIYSVGAKYYNCTADSCGGTGLEGAMATDCTASRCGSDGITCDVATRCETLLNAGHGFLVLSAVNCVATLNGGDGFYVPEGVVTGCISHENSGHGIFAPDSVVSQSIARRNGKHGIAAERGVISFCTAGENNKAGGSFRNLSPRVTVAAGSGAGIEGTVSGNFAPAP